MKWSITCQDYNCWGLDIPKDMDIQFNFPCANDLYIETSPWYVKLWRVTNWNFIHVPAWRILIYWEGCNNYPITVSYKQVNIPVVEDNTVFWSVVTWISDTMWEFIPYMVYLWFWTLIISLSFVAVKWLMVWIWNKIKKYFRSK